MSREPILLTDTEKIDEIYRYFRKRRLSDIFELCWKWGIRIFVLSSLAYVYLHPSFVSDLQLENKLGSFVSSIASPIVKDIVESQKGALLPQ